MWPTFYVPPIKMTTYHWTISNPDMFCTEGRIIHKQIYYLSKPGNICEKYHKSNNILAFNDCTIKYFEAKLFENISCTIVGK